MILQRIVSKIVVQPCTFFKPTCVQPYRKKNEVEKAPPFKDRFQVKDATYLLPHFPLKPLTAYNIFTLLYMKIIRENYPNEATSVVLKKLSTLWNDDEFMIEHKLEVLNLSKFQYDLFYKEQQYFKQNYECPIEPIGPYQIFLKEHYKRVQDEMLENNLARITAKITSEWKELPVEKKAEYSALFQERFKAHKEKIQKYNSTYKIPILRPKNLYNIYVQDQFSKKKIKFSNSQEMHDFQMRILKEFNELPAEEKRKFEELKENIEQDIKAEIDRFKVYFDLSDADYADICSEVKQQLAAKSATTSPSNSKEPFKHSELNPIFQAMYE